jgi:hypothetical protein
MPLSCILVELPIAKLALNSVRVLFLFCDSSWRSIYILPTFFGNICCFNYVSKLFGLQFPLGVELRYLIVAVLALGQF